VHSSTAHGGAVLGKLVAALEGNMLGHDAGHMVEQLHTDARSSVDVKCHND
jgi:hypothetical protein